MKIAVFLIILGMVAVAGCASAQKPDMDRQMEIDLGPVVPV